MQDDARSHRISSEVLKRCLYSSVISSSPYRRRQSDHRRAGRPPSMHGDAASYYEPIRSSMPAPSRWAQSLPVSPAQSHVTSPIHSPTNLHHTFMSRGATPRNSTPDCMDYGSTSTLDVEEDSWKGLPSLFKPRPRYIPGAPMHGMSESLDETVEMSYDNSRAACEGVVMCDRQYQSLAGPM